MKKLKQYLVGLLRKNRQQKGFTLIEMVVVIAIIVILLIIIAPNLIHQKDNADHKSRDAFKTTLETQVELYKMDDNIKDKELKIDSLAKAGYLTQDQVAKAAKYKLTIDSNDGKIVDNEKPSEN
ncbi:competence type IV pilus major pilin ComGC [Lactobacillus gigeriorum]|uniref:ComG operon protein ComGC n=1 Tax=Lactobacillus gigeriorum DSM 23908 = CRBIP 24.85 TaxID=1423751 RepID=I7J322_9LACO|nr:competence type IV pilus major pilin ComGC [Lactobacillus gigeriorum]KRN14793.1 hypothetical protein FC38_GL000085 [Lactobacillus gigeriorum DSM 23908 = CRBIP 24.85]CCI87257.1 ComG operon protein ComGC [Lactobacillus gigeriorum DSM 23908 = CRBIP 24.85]